MVWNLGPSRNTDKSSADESVERATPIPEHVAGVVFPYRGQEQHGVPPTSAPYILGADEWHIDPGEYEPPAPVMDPIPVRVVTEDSREIRGFAVQQTIVDGQQRIIAGANERRKRVTIRNMDAAKTIYIGHDLTLSPTTGYPLVFGTSHTLENVETAIYGISADGTQVAVAIIQERTVAND